MFKIDAIVHNQIIINLKILSSKIQKPRDLWKYLQSDFVNGLFSGNYYNNRPTNLKSYLKDLNSLLITRISLRQARIKKGMHKNLIFIS
jgi:hypothetical protein